MHKWYVNWKTIVKGLGDDWQYMKLINPNEPSMVTKSWPDLAALAFHFGNGNESVTYQNMILRHETTLPVVHLLTHSVKADYCKTTKTVEGDTDMKAILGDEGFMKLWGIDADSVAKVLEIEKDCILMSEDMVARINTSHGSYRAKMLAINRNQRITDLD